MKALILTGGGGTRLKPFTLSVLKPLLPIVNLPFLAYPAALLRKHGVRQIVLCTGNSLDPYQNLIEEQKELGTQVTCSREPEALGTGGAVKNAQNFIDSSTFAVFNGDTLT